ncbi:hypothetical protein ACT2CI_00520 [Candidatus Vidania fulgoroideorum]
MNCLIGFGTLGQSFLNAAFKKKININFIIIKNFKKKKNLEKKLKKYKKKIYLYKKYRKIINYKKTKKIIELTNNYNLCKINCFTSIIKKKKIITANKNFIYKNFKKINKYINKIIFIEPSVFGGTPIINDLINHYKYFKIKEIKSIINGTTNFILNNVFSNKIKILNSLEKAIKKGYSEKSPLYDIKGIDTFQKIFILVSMIKKIEIKNSYISGIQKINYKIIKNIIKKNKKIIILGYLKIKKIFFSIESYCYIAKNFVLKKSYNLIKISTFSGKFIIKGKGAGKITSYSCINNFYNNKKNNNKKKTLIELDINKKKIIIFSIKKKLICFIKNYCKFKKKKKYIILDKQSNKRILFLKKNLKIYEKKIKFLKIL